MNTAFYPENWTLPLTLKITHITGSSFAASSICPPNGANMSEWVSPSMSDLFLTVTRVAELADPAGKAKGGGVLAIGGGVFMGALIMLCCCCACCGGLVYFMMKGKEDEDEEQPPMPGYGGNPQYGQPQYGAQQYGGYPQIQQGVVMGQAMGPGGQPAYAQNPYGQQPVYAGPGGQPAYAQNPYGQQPVYAGQPVYAQPV
jgi:hypothetical protein